MQHCRHAPLTTTLFLRAAGCGLHERAPRVATSLYPNHVCSSLQSRVPQTPAHTLSHSHTLSLTHTLFLSHTHSLTHTLSLTHTHTLSPSQTPSLTHTLSHTPSHTLTLPLSPDGRQAVPMGVKGVLGGLHQLRVVGKPKVVVGTEVQDTRRATQHGHTGGLGAGDDTLPLVPAVVAHRNIIAATEREWGERGCRRPCGERA